MIEKTAAFDGPWSYENLRAFATKQSPIGVFEYQLYSDTWVTGEVVVDAEPYQFFNLVPFGRANSVVRPMIVLRLGLHVDRPDPRLDKTDTKTYHGGGITEEVAALASLLIGVRLRAGGQTRRFDEGGDPRGRPVSGNVENEPSLDLGIRGTTLPALVAEKSMMPLQRIRQLSRLSPAEAVVLIRAARLYQDATWLAETQPNLGWLLMVSAVEAVASSWHVEKGEPLERLRVAKPEFVEWLETSVNSSLATRIATEFAESFGSTRKFVSFLLEHMPPPPSVRPAEWGQVTWTPPDLKKVFSVIYDYRSRALHDGIPFPAPMCEPPFRHDSWPTVAEKPIGLAANSHGGTWVAKDTPMLLHTFEYIARAAILDWWERRCSE